MPRSKPQRREQTYGSFIVVLWSGQTGRFHDMPRAQDWALERLQGQKVGAYAAFYRAPVAEGRHDVGAPWTEPFHVLIVNDYGRIVVADRTNWPNIPPRGQMFPYRGSAQPNKRQHRRNETVDFDDEDAVLAEVATALKEDPEDCSIEEDAGLTGFGEGTVYRVTCARTEYCVVQDNDTAYDLAKAVVTQDLEEEPEIFNKDFIERHINTDRLRRDLHNDVRDMAEEDLREMSDRDFWRTAESYIEVPEEDDDGDMPDTDDYVEDVAEKMAEERLKDPMEYLEEIYGDEAAAQAIKIAGIDIDAAAEDAVDSDGWQHFLARYDGNSDETSSGFVFWREN